MEGGVLHGGLPAVAVGGGRGRGGGGRGGGGGGRGQGRGRGHRVVRLPRRSTFVSVSRRVIVALVTLVVEIYHISGKDSTNLQKALKMLAPITSMYSVVEVFKKYTNLLNYGPYYYFEEEGERIWHSPTSWEFLSLLFALLHAASSIFNFLKAANGWEFGGAVSSSHPFVFSTLFVCVLVTEFCSTF